MLVSTVLSLYHAAVSPARACDLAEGRVGLSIARADGARGARRKNLEKNEINESMRLAYSTTSSPPRRKLFGPAAHQRQARLPVQLRAVPRQLTSTTSTPLIA